MKKITLLFLLFGCSTFLFAQRLERSKSNLKKKKITTTVIKEKKQSNQTQNEYEGSSFKDILIYELLIKPVSYAIGAITYGVFIETPQERKNKHAYMEFTPYPYFNQQKGDYTYNPTAPKPLRVEFSDQLLFNGGNIYGNQLNARLRFAQRASLEYSQLYLIEHLKNNNYHFYTHNLNLNYYRIRTKTVTLHYGLGITHIYSNVNKTYPNYKMGLSYFFNKPISLNITHKGTIQYGHGLYETTVDFNYYKNKYAIKGGFHYYSIGGYSYPMLALGGKVYL